MERKNFIEVIFRRKSMRRFKEYTVSKEDILTLLECARWAPSGKNTQPWEFLVVDNKEDIATIYNFGCRISYTFKKDKFLNRNPCRFDETSVLIFILGRASAYAAENIVLAACALGYGSCLLGAFDKKRTAKLLGVPEEKQLQLCVAIGKADEPRSNEVTEWLFNEGVIPYPADTRKPLKEIAFYGRYGVGIKGDPKRKRRSTEVSNFKE
jgi:nitroreductase